MDLFTAALGAFTKVVALFPAAWRWMRRNQAEVRVATVEYRAKTHAGRSIYIRLLNRTQREQKIRVLAYLDSGEQLMPRTNQGIPTIPATIRPEDDKELWIPLMLMRENNHARPHVERIEVLDAVDRKILVPKKDIERLNDQILNEWPYDDEGQ
jgi:hypothetical protein